jgi:hypothetical protein
MRFIPVMAVLLLAALGAASDFVDVAHADRRVALVVGNGAYRHADRLANPVNDARGMRDALKRLGFEVTFGEDLDQKALRRAIGQFSNGVEGADVAIVYYAGHGATFGDTPYVVPVDAEFASLGEVPYELVAVETLIGELRRARGVRIAILDACRDNAAEHELKRQLAARGGAESRGLGPMKNPEGLILAYATQYLSTAADTSGGGGNSPFTAALLNNIATPGLDVKDLFFKVGRDVVAATGGRQRPEISISMYDQYALVAKPDAAPPSAMSRPVAPPPAAVAAPQLPPAPKPPTLPAATKVLDLSLATLTDELRKQYNISDRVKGAVITALEPGSSAAEKRLGVGEVVVEVSSEPVNDAAAVQKRIDQLRRDGKRTALLLIATAAGDMRFVALGLQ